MNECVSVSRIYFAPVVFSTLRDVMEGIRSGSGLDRKCSFLANSDTLTGQKQAQSTLGGHSCKGRNLADYPHTWVYSPIPSFVIYYKL